MKPKPFYTIFILLALVVFQVCFLARFDFYSGTWLRYFNGVIAFVLILSLFEKRREKASYGAAALGGAMLDFYSEYFFGFWILISVFCVLAVKYVIRKYVRVPVFW